MPISKPLIGITLGDAAGIGPEIILKTISDKKILNQCRILIIGDSKILQNASEKLHLPFRYPIYYDIPGPCTAPVTLLDLKLFKKLPKLSNQTGKLREPLILPSRCCRLTAGSN